MKGDTVSLPIYGTVIKHEWQPIMHVERSLRPAIAHSRAKPAPSHRASEAKGDRLRDRMMAALRKSVDGMTTSQLVTACNANNKSVSAIITSLMHDQEIVGAGNRKVKISMNERNGAGIRTMRVYKAAA